LKEFGLKEKRYFVCVIGIILIEIFLGHFPRTTEDKRREKILLNSALFVQNRPKFDHRIVRPFHFCSALFDLCGVTIGQLAMLRELSPLSFSLVDVH
jgi:hypothetical protein